MSARLFSNTARPLLWTLPALLAGILWTAVNLHNLPPAAARLRTRAAVLEELRQWQMEHARLRHARDVFEQMPRPSRAADPARLAAGHLPGVSPEVSERGAEQLPHGWRIRRVEIRFGEADLAAVGEFMRAAAAIDPPWMLRAADINVTPYRPGFGRVVLRLEALERE